jgi:hypothetical protein
VVRYLAECADEDFVEDFGFEVDERSVDDRLVLWRQRLKVWVAFHRRVIDPLKNQKI